MKLIDLIDQEETSKEYKQMAEKLLNINTKPIVNIPKPGRNDPCPCGSGKKYKNCCMNINDELINKIEEWEQ